ncbi:MAG TPA: hypothetical protein VF525_07995 [Pyrinomonadaceae bacterium]|jgi:hypothetical protein
MDNAFRQSVIQDLEKSGFGSEMRAIKIFLSEQWSCSGSPNYFDKDEQRTRECDLQAHRMLMKRLENDKYIQSFYHIVAEVKKSEKPWVVFREDLSESPLRTGDAWNNLTFSVNLPFKPSRLFKDMTSASLISQLKWRGYGAHECFKKPDSPSRWYSSCMSACKAAEHVLEGESWQYKEDPAEKADIYENPPYLVFVKPLVILDGILLAADLSDEGEMSIAEINAAPMDFYFKSKAYNRSSYRPDIVTINGLRDYIQLSNIRHDHIHQGLLRESRIEA